MLLSFARRTGSVFALFILLLTSCAPSTTAPEPASPTGPQVRVEVPASAAKGTDGLKAFINVAEVNNLTALEIHLTFDPNVIEIVSTTNGGFIKDDFKVQDVFSNTTGTIDYAIAQINGTPASGSGTLLEIVFRAKAAGSTQIRFRKTSAAPEGLLLSDSTGTAIKVALVNATVTIGK